MRTIPAVRLGQAETSECAMVLLGECDLARDSQICNLSHGSGAAA